MNTRYFNDYNPSKPHVHSQNSHPKLWNLGSGCSTDFDSKLTTND
ncbi:hypothetical protein IAD21_00662 [Abditibacteriota bacterium]|nr:hypothetical protein IAD21_00662 [Abditibacteriota bacterium]